MKIRALDIFAGIYGSRLELAILLHSSPPTMMSLVAGMGSEYVSNDLMGDEGSFLKSEEARNQGGPAIPETVIGNRP
jgi:hypothetical protein